MSTRFKKVDPRSSFPNLEQEVLGFWRDEQIFSQSITSRQSSPEFVVYEGPPTANGNPGIHHAQARAYKDLFPRYKTMRGYKVRRKAGWDCHGLPVEIEVEKRLGFSGKPAIETYGIEPFNKQCRSSVMTYEGAWRELTERIGYWTDLDNPYMTMTNDYVESVWWSLKQLWNKGLLYLGYKVVPFCARCGTPLSSAEAGSAYKDVEDPSLYVRFPLCDPQSLGLPQDSSLLVWTTTPWTLPGNTGAAVSPDMKYVAVEHKGQILVLAECLLKQALGQDAQYQVLASIPGKDLEGAKYVAPYTWFDFGEKVGHRVVLGSFVTAEDGTGIVHIAPAFGADDLEMSRQFGLPVIHPVKTDGHFVDGAHFLAGMWFKDADSKVIADLRERGILYRIQKYLHSYPHCWRCGTPLLYYATDSWYINNTSLKQRLLEKNQEIDWHPAHIQNGRYGDWLNNLVDWAISRTRYWGTPLPIWQCDHCEHRECVGSFAELAERSVNSIDVTGADFDPHRPYVDAIQFQCSECKGTMHRVSDVIDCWYDSGSMPFAQLHYPFENRELFEASFPADFICEGLDQTRGWFNSLHQLGVMLFDSIAYRSVICHGLVLDGNGEKMSKSRGNVVNPWDVLNTAGADALRWYIYTSAPPESNRRCSVELVTEATKHLNTWWNTYQFFLMNVNASEITLAPCELSEQSNWTELDRWIMARLHQTIKETTDCLDVFEPTRAARALESFVDDLSNWYVRRSRRRFWDNELSAYQTLYNCLLTLAKLQAPFTPFLAESMYGVLVAGVEPQAPVSVHLSDWPKYQAELIDEQLLAQGALVVEVVSVGRASRNASKQKVRQPLAEVLIGLRSNEDRAGVERFSQHILEELNVKSIRFLDSDAQFLDYSVKPNLPTVGPKYGKLLGGIRQVLASEQAKTLAVQALRGEAVVFSVKDQQVELEPNDLLIEVKSPEGYSAQEINGLMVAVSTTVTEELRSEGVARDVVRHIQELRKSADFEISDRINVWISEGSDDLYQAVISHRESIMKETLCLELSFEPIPSQAFSASIALSKNEPEFKLGVMQVRI